MMGVSWGFPKTTIGNFRLSLLKKPGGFLVVYLLTRKQWGFPKTTIGNFRFSLLKKPGGFLVVELNSIETYAPNFLDITGGPLKLQLLGVSWGFSEAATLTVHPLIIYFKVMCWQYMYMSSASHFIPKHIFLH